MLATFAFDNPAPERKREGEAMSERAEEGERGVETVIHPLQLESARNC